MRARRTLCFFSEKKSAGFGPNQYASIAERGARDAFAWYVLLWILGLNDGKKIGVFCSDVAGAFDRMSCARLLDKLVSKGVPVSILRALASWLAPRSATVIVDGRQSVFLRLRDMVFQGTVLGPSLWNACNGDARLAVGNLDFQEAIYADDLTSRSSRVAVPTPSSWMLCTSASLPFTLEGAPTRLALTPRKKACVS